MGKDCLQGHQGSPLHADWWWPLNKIPRAWTSFGRSYLWGWLDFSRPPRYLFGNLSHRSDSGDWGEYRDQDGALHFYPKPVPRPRKWYVAWPFYFAWTFDLFCRWRGLLRFGCRYTEVTKGGEIDPGLSYYTVPAGPAIRDIGGG